jgi:two-component system, NtrC family, nitrogen regulation response regulator GlnG
MSEEDAGELTTERPASPGSPGGTWSAPSGATWGESSARVPALTILAHPDPRRVGEVARLHDLSAGGEALLSRTAPGFSAPGESTPRPLADRHLSRRPMRLAASPGGLRLEVGESRTRVVAESEPVGTARDFSAHEVERGAVIELADRIVLLLHLTAAVPLQDGERFGMIGDSEAIARVRHEVCRVAELDLTVLLRGETGTGKELVARAIHEASPRCDGPFLCVNMGAIPTSLAPSELFGAVKGSFTDARDHAGYFQRAHGGTLFLDEIGETPPEVQVMLLRALESGEIQRVGAQNVQRVDARLVAATDVDLERAVAEGRFREQLRQRLSVYEIYVPPLRERRDDLGRLLFTFLREELREIGEEHRLDPAGDAHPWMPAAIVARLARHDWPGNVRQLRNVARQIVVASRGFDTVQIGLQVERLLREAAAPPPAEPPAPIEPPAPPRRRAPAASYRSPSEVTEAELLAALCAHEWKVKRAAVQLGIARPSLYVLLEKFPAVRKARMQYLKSRYGRNDPL